LLAAGVRVCDINYKELYDCKWDPMTLTNNTLYTPAFKFLYIFWPDDEMQAETSRHYLN